MMRLFLSILMASIPASSNELWDLLRAKQFDRAKALLNQEFYVDSKEEGSSAIHLATKDGNLDAVKFLIAQGSDIDDPDQHANTPLMLAAARGDLEMVQFLVGRGASLQAVSEEYRTPLMTAIRFSRDSVAEFLLSKTKDPLFEPPTHVMASPSSALFLAVEGTNNAIFERLFAIDPNPNRKLRDGRTLLMAAAGANSPELVKRLLSLGADNSSVDNRGNTALHHACQRGADTSVLELLLLHGADPDVRNQDRETPLHLAVAAKKPGNVRVLLRGKINLELQDRWSQTPMRVAMDLDLQEIVQLLKNKGAKPMSAPPSGPDSIAVLSDHNPEFAKMAIASGLDVNAKVYPYKNAGREGWGRILTFSASHGWNDVIDLALSKGADPNLTNGEHRSPLQCAMEKKQYGAFQLLITRGAKVDSAVAGEYLRWLVASDDSLNGISALLRRGADVNDRSRTGQTPLMIAAKEKQPMNLKVLLKSKADPTLRDGRGRTALHEAIDGGCFDCVQVLVEKGAPVKDAFPPRHSLASLAISRQDTAMAAWLLAKGAPAVLAVGAYEEVFGGKGSSAVAWFVLRKFPKVDLGEALLNAASTNNLDLIRGLIDKRADVNVRDTQGRTPLMIACDNSQNNQEIRDLLESRGAKLKVRDNNGLSAEQHCASFEGE